MENVLGTELSGQDVILEEIKDVGKKRPNLTEEEQKTWDELKGKILPHVAAIARLEARQEIEPVLLKKQAEFNEELRAATMTATQMQIDQWKKDQTPTSPEELSTLLAAEYVTFKVPIATRKRTTREFVIQELPQFIEDKFLKTVKNKIVANLKDITAIEWSATSSMLEQLAELIGLTPELLDTAAETVAICLNPYDDERDEDDKLIDAKWCKRNMSTYRMAMIIVAQYEANKYRNFLSKGSPLLKVFQTMS
jgi:hypothetical protein